MSLRRPRLITRRRFLFAGVSIPVPFLVAACGGGDSSPDATATPSPGQSPLPATTTSGSGSQATATATAVTLSPTPACTDDDDPTPEQIEGPFFTPDSPQRTSLLEPGVAGTTLMLTGQVLSTSCQPVGGALIDFWQCDGAGVYDNEGYTLRGHQFADADGNYSLETIVPGLYPGRTRHIHVKVQAANRPVLTTQLYFPGEPRNQEDRIYAAECEISNYRDAASGKEGSFSFVLDV